MDEVLESTSRVMEKAEHVQIDSQKAEEVATMLSEKEKKHWLEGAPFDISQLSEEKRMNFLAVLDSLSFSYWGDPKWRVEHGNEKIDGAYAMIAALGKAVQNGVPLTDFKYLGGIRGEDLAGILKGERVIPLFYERAQILRVLGATAEVYFDGSLMNCISKAKSADDLCRMLAKEFSFFNDVSTHNGQKVYFYKKAQLLVADLFHSVTHIREAIGNIAGLTACADYKLPQMLRKWGVLKYSDDLSEVVDFQHEIGPGSQAEVEIRSATICAVEEIKSKLSGTSDLKTSVDVNDAIWLEGQKTTTADKPYHRTRTIFY